MVRSQALVAVLRLSMGLLALLAVLGRAGETAWPLWDGKEAVADYAKRVNLSATKSFDLGKGISLDFVLIPAGKFIFGVPEPKKPVVTVIRAQGLLIAGWIFFGILLHAWVKHRVKAKRTFSLRWLFAMMIACGLMVGGIAQWSWALREEQRYAWARSRFDAFHPSENGSGDVLIAQPFYMGKFSVTQEQYEIVVGRNPAWFKGTRNPVERVTWYDALDYCKKVREYLKVNGQDTEEFQLPSEEQWEYACKSGRDMDAVYVELNMSQYAWSLQTSEGKTHPAGLKRPNDFGLFDVYGNVRQWCMDYYDKALNTNSRVTRGASWKDQILDHPASLRNDEDSSVPQNYVGFRLVLPISPR